MSCDWRFVLTAKRRRSLWRHLLRAGTRTTLCEISYPWIFLVDIHAVSWISLLRTAGYWHVLNWVPKLPTRLTQSVTLRDTRGSNLGQKTVYRKGSRGFSQCLKQAYYPFLPSIFQFIIDYHSINRCCITDNVVKQRDYRTTEASLPTNVSSEPFLVFKIRNCKSSVMDCQSGWITSLEAHSLAESLF